MTNTKTELGLFHYKLLFSINEKTHMIHDEQTLLNSILEDLASNTNAQIGIFFIFKYGRPIPVSSFGIKNEVLKSLNFKAKDGILAWLTQYDQILKVDNILSDKRFVNSGEPLFGLGLKLNSFIAAPIKCRNEIMGAVELFNPSAPFSQADLETLSIIGKELGMALKNISLLESVSGKCDYLSIIVNNLNSGLIVLNSEDKIAVINPKAMEILEIPDSEKIKQERPEIFKKLKELLKAGKNLSRQEMGFEAPSGKKILGYSSVHVKDSARSGIIFLFQDITKFVKKTGSEKQK